QSVSLALFGESHGPLIGAVLDGMAPGIEVDEARIAESLRRRRPSGAVSTSRREADEFRIVSGVMNGRTTGTPITILIPNSDVDSSVYAQGPVRPGHADYAAFEKYHGYEDWRGGGHFSGRITAALVAAGAIAESALLGRGIKIGTHIAECACVRDVPFSDDAEGDIDRLRAQTFPVLCRERGEEMQRAVEAAAAEGDSVGGILETCVTGVPAGVGEPWFDTVEGLISHALFSIPSVKGVEFGQGFAFSRMRGSLSNDPFRIKDGRIVTSSNNSGGINGGITN
ncbi:MAG: chorismate synthase, partial [Lachnospiraceae bacterium]|nr:chorismate synthase [Lachnospiraceae bacterium]